MIKDLFGIIVIQARDADENCKCRKKIVASLIEEYTDTVEEVKPAKIALAENENSYKCSSCTVYTMLFWIIFTINVGIVPYYEFLCSLIVPYY